MKKGVRNRIPRKVLGVGFSQWMMGRSELCRAKGQKLIPKTQQPTKTQQVAESHPPSGS